MKKINIKERTGYVFEENSKWYARVTISDKKGKRRNIKRTSSSKSAAKELLKKLLKQLDDEGIKAVESWQMTFNKLADYYALHYVKSAKFIDNQKIEGLRDTKRIQGFLKHFRIYFGNMKLSEITYGDIFSYRSERLNIPTPKGTARTITTMNRELACLRRILNTALRQGWINKNPINCGEPLILTSCERMRERVLTATEENILTDNGTEFKGTDLHPFQVYLEFNDIRHRTTRVRRPQTNGFIERFNRTVLDEFFRVAFRQRFYESVEQLQTDLDEWLKFYNTERPHQGYRNMGRKPIETVMMFVQKET